MAELHRRYDGEGPQVFWRWKFRDQTFWIDVKLDPPCPRREVKVQTPLKSLLHQILIPRNQPKRIVSLRKEVGLSIFLVQGISFGLLLVSRKVLLRWVVGFSRPGRWELRSGHVHGVRNVLIGLGPDCIDRWFRS